MLISIRLKISITDNKVLKIGTILQNHSKTVTLCFWGINLDPS